MFKIIKSDLSRFNFPVAIIVTVSIFFGAFFITSALSQQAVPSNSVASSQSQPATITNDVTVQGDVADGTTDSGNTVKTGGVYNSTLPNYSANARVHWQFTQHGAAITAKMAPDNVVVATSGVVANTIASATLPAAVGKTTYISGFQVTADGATSAACTGFQVTGTLNSQLNYVFCWPAGVTTPATPLIVNFDPPLPATAANTTISVSVPAAGAGNTGTAVNAFGFQQ